MGQHTKAFCLGFSEVSNTYENKNSIMVSSLVGGPLCDRSNSYKKYIAIYIVNFILL